MTSKAATVAEYMKEVPAERQKVMAKLRALCRKMLAGYQEGMDYGMPVYKRGGKPEVALASQKQYVALYVMKTGVVNEFREELGADCGKGCIRFKKPDAIDFGVVERLLKRTAESGDEAC